MASVSVVVTLDGVSAQGQAGEIKVETPPPKPADKTK